MYFLDFGRILCIACVVTEHAGSNEYAGRNIGFALWWVLQFLYLISGWCTMLSSSPLVFYVLRLLVVFLVGVGLNWIADIINDRDWQGDFFNTIFQMMFVVMLIFMAVLNYPLRRALLWRFANPIAPAGTKLKIATGVYGCLAAAGIILYLTDALQPSTPSTDKMGMLVDQIGLMMADFFTMAFLVVLAMCLGTTRWLPGVVLIWMYLGDGDV